MERLAAILFLFSSLQLIAQVENEKEIIIENAVSNSDEEFENENIIEDLRFLLRQPIYVNDSLANYGILFQYGLLTPIQARAIKEYVKTYGPFITKKELIAVPGINNEELEAILPYLSVFKEEQQQLGVFRQLQVAQSRLIVRNQLVLEKQAGYQSTDSTRSKFAGDPNHLYIKFRHRYKNQLSIGLLSDKDSGEQLFKGENKAGFDFYSAHIKYRPQKRWINQINIGDYEVKIGQGLIQWNGFSLGKGADATTVFQKSPILREYTSSNEINFLRGVAADFRFLPELNATIWVSHKQMDGNQLYNDSLQLTGRITSLPLTGYHRTKGEIIDKGSTTENIYGTNIEFSNEWLKVGVTGQHRKLSDSLIYRNQEYQRFYPKGTDFSHVGIHYSILKKRNYFFGETAFTNDLAYATVNGIQHFFPGSVKGTFVYRNYTKDYQSFYSNGFGENTSVNNEEGIYVGLQYSPAKNFTIQTYYDWFRFPWKKFRVSKPSTGNELFLQATYEPTEQVELEFRTRLEQKQIDISGNLYPSKILTNQKRYSSRLELRYRPNELLYFKSRIGHSFFEAEEKEHGILLFQDLIYQFPSTDVKLYGRFANFNTDSFDSRVYAYENDLLYNFSVPAFYGKGSRWYAMVSYAPIRNIKFWVKGSQTIFSDREQISSGNTAIDGNTRTDLKLQAQWSF